LILTRRRPSSIRPCLGEVGHAPRRSTLFTVADSKGWGWWTLPSWTDPIGERLDHLRDRLEKDQDPEARLRWTESWLARLLRLFGPNGAPTTRARADAAKYLEAMDRFEEARPLREQVADAYRRNLGDEQPDTLISEEWFAINLSRCGMLMESRALLSHVLEVRLRTLGDADDQTIRRSE
jgi:hypothetical protein